MPRGWTCRLPDLERSDRSPAAVLQSALGYHRQPWRIRGTLSAHGASS